MMKINWCHYISLGLIFFPLGEVNESFEFLLAYDGVLLAPEMEIGGTLIADEPQEWL
jgi:hypothetical protein